MTESSQMDENCRDEWGWFLSFSCYPPRLHCPLKKHTQKPNFCGTYNRFVSKCLNKPLIRVGLNITLYKIAMIHNRYLKFQNNDIAKAVICFPILICNTDFTKRF